MFQPKLSADGSVADFENPNECHFLSNVLSAIGGGSAANAMKDGARANRNYATNAFDEIKRWTNPYIEGSEDAAGSYYDLLQSPGELDPVSSELQRRDLTNVYNMLRARGQGASGQGWNALMDTSMRGTLGYRNSRMSELLNGMGFGQNAINQRISGLGVTMPAVTGANTAMADAKGYNQSRWWNLPSQIESQAMQMAGVAAGGGFG